MNARPIDSPILFAELGLGTKVHALQAEFLASSHPVRIIVGGRRAGKSLAVALLIVWLVARHALEGKPFRILISAPTLDQARVVLGYVLGLVRGSPVASIVTREVESPFPQIEFAGGIVIMCRSLAEHAKHVRGHGNFDLLVLDEAGFVPDGVVEQVLAPLLADRAGSMIMSSTPNVRGSLLERWFVRGRDGDERIKSFHFPSTSNPFLDQAYVETMRRELPRDVWECEWEGNWGEAQGSVFRFSDILACTTGVEGAVPDLPRYVLGFDPARLRDASALVVMETSSTPKRIVQLEDLSGSDYTKQVERVATVAKRFGGSKVVVDGTGVGVVVTDLLRAAGLYVESITITSARKQEMVASLAVAIEKKALSFAPDRRLLDELRWFRGTRTSNGSTKFEAAPGARDDFIMATCLALAGSGGVVKPTDWPSLGMNPFIRTNDRATFGVDGRPLITRPDWADGFPAGSWSDWGPWSR